MTLSVRFENRDFTAYAQKHWETLTVDKFVNQAMGRAKKATIIARGSQRDLWEFMRTLRCPVYLLDESRAKNVWWGFANRVTIFEPGAPPFSASLHNMANRIAVAYSYQNKRFTTSWEQNTESDAEFGQKDLLLSQREKSATMAAQFRSTELENRKYPLMDPAFTSRTKKFEAKIYLKGWMDTLDWRYYAQDEGNIIYEEIGAGEREIGEDDRPKAAQGFQLNSAAGWTITSIWLRVKKVGTPADNFQVALYDDNATTPNASQSATPNLAGGSITTAYVWYEFILDTPFAASTGTLYWIHIQRSGAVDSSNFYMIDTNGEQGYADGNLYIQRSSDSSWYNKNMDALFRVVGEEATTAQIIDIVSTAGEFFIDTDIIDASGVNSTMFRAGDQTALYEILELLKTGTTNNRRLLAEVTETRVLKVFEEPARNASNYSLFRDGTITDENDNILPPQDCPVGVWMSLKDFIPSTVDASRLIQPSPIFVEEAVYDAIRDEYRITKARSGVSAAESLTKVIDVG